MCAQCVVERRSFKSGHRVHIGAGRDEHRRDSCLAMTRGHMQESVAAAGHDAAYVRVAASREILPDRLRVTLPDGLFKRQPVELRDGSFRYLFRQRLPCARDVKRRAGAVAV